ncbi:hypothetical protein MNBD_GAMMA08-8 [hydrothermal vent metagenome]|uniref:Uncharacterized protein n=1 Tax=hydrothermal vent metagenome TaxID=652676 RepID=A0A3B0X4R3_9ZZZZ
MKDKVTYCLLKELPFLRAGTVFTLYRVVGDKKEFCIDNGQVSARIFNTYEDGILRSILEQSDWVERIDSIEETTILAQASFKESYDQEWLEAMPSEVVEILYESYVIGYLAALTEYKVEK